MRAVKIILGILGVVIIGVVVAIAVSWSRIPGMIASKLSQKMQVSVTIGGMQFGWHAINMQKVVVGNPPRSILPKAFSAETILIQAPITEYIDNPIVIDLIELDDVYVGLEFDSKKNTTGNWTKIMSNMQGGQKTAPGKGKVVMIKKLVLTNIDIALAYRDGGGVKNLDTIPRLEFNNVNSEEGIPTEQISQIIFNQMLKQIFSIENLGNMLQNILAPSGNPVQNVLKGLFGIIPGAEK